MKKGRVKVVLEDLRGGTYFKTGSEFSVVKMYNTVSYRIGEDLAQHRVAHMIKSGTEIEIVKYKRDR